MANNNSLGPGGLSAYSIGSAGALTALPGSPYATGSAGGPYGVTIRPDGTVLYVSNNGSSAGTGGLSAYALSATGTLTPLSGSPCATGSTGSPVGVAIVTK